MGGRTIAEAQDNMLYPEFLAWQAYRDKYGTLSMQKRIERVTALFFHYLFNGKVPLEDLFFFSENEPKTLSLEEAKKTWK